MTRLISQFFVFMLLGDAAVVAIGLSKKKNMWRLIVLYWVLLTLKNLTDFIGTL